MGPPTARPGIDAGGNPSTSSTCPGLPPTPSCADADNPWLLFDYGSDRGNYAIYAVRADGTHLHALPLPDAPAYAPAVSPDGKAILYVTTTADESSSSLRLYTIATARVRTLASGWNLDNSTMSKDQTTVAYIANNDLRLVGADGTNDRLLASTGYSRPRFRCDGSTVYVAAEGALVAAVAADGGVTPLISSSGANYPDFDLSPDGSQVITGDGCNRTGEDYELRLYSFAALPLECGAGAAIPVQGLHLGELQASLPTWSATGIIAFVQGADTFVVPVAGGTARSVTAGELDTSDAARASDPAWMPPCAEVP